MKIAIIPSYGSNRDMFRAAMNATGIRLKMNSKSFRKDLAEQLDKLEPNFKVGDINQSVYNKLYNEEIKYIRCEEEPENIYFKMSEGWSFRIQIVEPDENKVWRISDYDGSEYIEYWNPYPKLVNEETGEHEW